MGYELEWVGNMPHGMGKIYYIKYEGEYIGEVQTVGGSASAWGRRGGLLRTFSGGEGLDANKDSAARWAIRIHKERLVNKK